MEGENQSLDQRLLQASINARVKKALFPILDDFTEFMKKGVDGKEELAEASNRILEMLRVSFQEFYAHVGAHINSEHDTR